MLLWKSQDGTAGNFNGTFVSSTGTCRLGTVCMYLITVCISLNPPSGQPLFPEHDDTAKSAINRSAKPKLFILFLEI